jgi:simple sugar transport system substrate-binding protein
MKVKSALLAIVAIGALVLSGCSTSDDSGDDGGDSTSGGGGGADVDASDLRIDVVTHGNPGDTFWDVVKSGAEQAGDDLDVDLRYQNGTTDPAKQSTLIDAAVADGTDGLVISMANPDGVENSVRAAVDAGIPVITINSGIDDWKDFGAITHVGQSETIAGQAAGDEMNEAGLTNVVCVIQEAGNVGLEQRCAGAADAFDGDMENLQVDNTDLSGSEATIESKLQDSSIDGVLTLGGDISGQAVKAVEASGSDAQIGTFDLNADVAKNIIDGKLLFAVDQQPFVQGYLGVTGIYLKLINGNDIGGGQPVYSGPAIITKDNAADVLKYADNGTR